MSNPQIGVVVPTLNSASTLDWTLCSLSNQRDVTKQILVADSGSTDGTLDICKKWAVDTIYVPAGNMYRAINAGLRRMDTEWITSLDSDDIVFPNSFARLIALGQKEGASLVYGDCDVIDYEGRFLFEVKSPQLARLRGVVRFSPVLGGRLGFTQPAAIYRRSAYQDLGGFNERYRLIGDYEFFFRLVSTGYHIAKLKRPAVSALRLHPSQASRLEAANIKNELAIFRTDIKFTISPGDFFDLLICGIQKSPARLSRLLRFRP